MRELITYSLKDFFRSHKYFPPVSTFLILLIIFYTYTPNPIIDSYAITALFLFVVSAWLCISVFSLDSPVQRQLMILHLKSPTRYYFSKWLSVWLMAMILTGFAFMYPIVFQMFQEPVTVIVGFVSLTNHILLASLGICIACFFSKVIMDSPVSSYGGLTLVIIVSLSAIGIRDVLPVPFSFITWLIPPSVSTQTSLIHWDGERVLDLAFAPFLYVILYSLVLLFLFLKILKK